MSALVPIVLYGWIPVAALLFALMPPPRAIVWATFTAWLFLPVGQIDTPFVDLTRATATGLGVILGLAIFARRSDRPPWRVQWVDLPMLAWCLCPLLTSPANGLGLYDGASSMTTRMITWGLPYLLGRTYLRGFEGLRAVAQALFVAGLVYAPLCLFEVRMSPQLHRWVYGEHQHGFEQTIRLGGTFRPMVFMEHGLMLGFFMSAASLVGIALWKRGGVKHMFGLPMGWLVAGLVVTTVLCQSFGALLLLALGTAVVWSGPTLRPLLVASLLVVPIAYLGLRLSGAWDGAEVVTAVESLDSDRAQSLAFRLEQEEILSRHALRHPLVGWGGYGRALPHLAGERGTVISDSLWIVALGENGLIGLVSVVLALLAPLVVWTRRLASRWWTRPAAVHAGALAVVLALFLADGMINMMINPIYLLAAGGLASFAERGRFHPVPAPLRREPTATAARPGALPSR